MGFSWKLVLKNFWGSLARLEKEFNKTKVADVYVYSIVTEL